MGKIEDALKRAKASHRNPAGPDQPSQRNGSGARDVSRDHTTGAIAGLSIFDDFARQARYCPLNDETMRNNRIMSDDQPLAIRSAYKMLRTRLLQRMRANRWNRLAISSARAGAGKTVTAINTAISIAREPNQRVILVDLDLRRPSIARYLGIDPQHDLGDFLLGKAGIEDVVVRTDIERLLIIPTTSTHDNSSELLSSQLMLELMRQLTADMGGCIFIFDFPPMLDADDLLAFSPNFDALLFVVADCETRRADLQQVEDLIRELEVLGVVLNKSDERSPTYY